MPQFLLIISLIFICVHVDVEAETSLIKNLKKNDDEKVFQIDKSREDTQKSSPSCYVSDQVWKQVQDLIIPNDHPIKEKLDQIFSISFRPFYDFQSMKAAGFTPAKPQPNTQVIVTRHPQLAGYVIKAYLDIQEDYFLKKPEHYYWIKRIQGANLVRNSIQKHSYEQLLKVPYKWIYLLPDEPLPPSPCLCKRFILIEEDMDIYDNQANKIFWKSSRVTHSLLNALYDVITEVRLFDGARIENCPISKDGRVALVDTQLYHAKCVKYEMLTPFLSPNNQRYWLTITKTK